MREGNITVAKTARFYILGELSAETREIWFACHGYAQLARFFARGFTGIVDASRVVVVPEALNRYYYETEPGVHAAGARVSATWMTTEDRENEITDYVAYLDDLFEHMTGGFEGMTVALGFSQGCATVSRWAALGRAPLDHVVLWGGGLPPELTPAPALLSNARLTLAIGDADPWVGEQRIAQEQNRLDAGGLAYRLLRFHGGHAIARAGLEELATMLRE